MRSVSCEFVKFGVVSFGFFCFLKEKKELSIVSGGLCVYEDRV